MTDPFEQLIEYRRQLREKQADGVSLRWGITQTVVTYPVRLKWHITRASEVPCRAECGALLVELGPRGMRQPWNMCTNCKRRSSVFVDLWQQ